MTALAAIGRAVIVHLRGETARRLRNSRALKAGRAVISLIDTLKETP